MRLSRQPGEVIDRDVVLPFRWDGREFAGVAGDTIVSALAASGVRVFSRSFKYHRPRGVLTASFVDPECTVQVGDEPNVRAGSRRLKAGMVVSPQNVWPSLRYDVKTANQADRRGAGQHPRPHPRPRSGPADRPDRGPMLAKVCAIDLSDRRTPDGTAFRSSVAKLATDVVRDDVSAGASYLLHCERSSGQYLFDMLLDAGAEYGIEPAGFAQEAW